MEHTPYERLRWRVLRTFQALPTEARAKEMTHRDYLWCALNMTLDEEEVLNRLCPSCRNELEQPHCPSCGVHFDAISGGYNASFDPDRYQQLKGGELP